jgi:hypothetical protein
LRLNLEFILSGLALPRLSTESLPPYRTLSTENTLQYAGGKGAQAQAKVSCPEVSCTSTTVLLGALAAQLVILMAYLMYRDNKEHQAKKFY